MPTGISKTLYTCDDPEALVKALTACSWRRETPDNRLVAARFSQRKAQILVYENGEVTASGMPAIQALDELWRQGDDRSCRARRTPAARGGMARRPL